jgi:hypothetical protein
VPGYCASCESGTDVLAHVPSLALLVFAHQPVIMEVRQAAKKVKLHGLFTGGNVSLVACNR